MRPNKINPKRHPTAQESAGQTDWFGSSRIKFDSPEAQLGSRSSHLELIKERIKLGFYSARDVDADISDKLAKAFFDLEG